MGHITISLEKNAEQLLRSIASEKYRNKKGALAKVIAESLKLFSKTSSRERAVQRQIKWMDEGFELGKVLVKSRDELYDR